VQCAAARATNVLKVNGSNGLRSENSLRREFLVAQRNLTRHVSAVGSFLVFIMSFVTLSLLITEHRFPLLSIAGRLVIKDAIMMSVVLVTMADSAKKYLATKVATSQVVSIRGLSLTVR
jgi:Protein of unknown function, DUF417